MLEPMHVNPSPASVQPYVPSLYLPGSLGRFRQYPRRVVTPIPGAGYNVGRGVWGEQVLYLGGYGDLFRRGRSYPYGKYAQVPLRGMGQVSASPWYMRGWVWALAGGGLAVLGAGSYLALRKNGRGRRRAR